ncbi:membrane dipeptidase [Rhodococcus sp. H29-C3]|nr:membrane dipeptidase [Rhodococcus sp. H29-C3]MDJ0362270.1 membrane dipeptidase [Rhodococcus sp. H29-C3]
MTTSNSPSSEQLRLHPSSFEFVDTHNDLLMLVVKRPRERWGRYFRDNWLPQLKAGGVGIQVLAVYVDHTLFGEASLREIFRMIEAAHVIAAENADTVRLCTGRAEIDRARAGDRIALVLAIEGCGAFAPNLELFGQVHRLGVRMISLVHMGRNAFADASDQDAAHGGLTSLGRDALGIIESLGMIFDISHLGAFGVDDVLGLAEQPMIASHSSARALRDHHRNLTDRQLRSVAERNGVVCVNFMASFLATSGATVQHLADHVEHIRAVAGPAHVGIGPDFVAEVFAEVAPATVGPGFADFDPIETIDGLEGPSGLPLLTEELQRRGWPDHDIDTLHRTNVLDLLGSICP